MNLHDILQCDREKNIIGLLSEQYGSRYWWGGGGAWQKGSPLMSQTFSQPEIASVGKGLKETINMPGAKQTCCIGF